MERAVRILVGRLRQTTLYGIIANVPPMGEKAFAIAHALVRESALPDFLDNTKLALSTKGKISFNELHGFFDTQIVIDRDQKVEMVGHHHEIVNCEDTLPVIRAQHVNEESCHPFGLKQGSPSVRF